MKKIICMGLFLFLFTAKCFSFEIHDFEWGIGVGEAKKQLQNKNISYMASDFLVSYYDQVQGELFNIQMAFTMAQSHLCSIMLTSKNDKLWEYFKKIFTEEYGEPKKVLLDYIYWERKSIDDLVTLQRSPSGMSVEMRGGGYYSIWTKEVQGGYSSRATLWEAQKSTPDLIKPEDRLKGRMIASSAVQKMNSFDSWKIECYGEDLLTKVSYKTNDLYMKQPYSYKKEHISHDYYSIEVQNKNEHWRYYSNQKIVEKLPLTTSEPANISVCPLNYNLNNSCQLIPMYFVNQESVNGLICDVIVMEYPSAGQSPIEFPDKIRTWFSSKYGIPVKCEVFNRNGDMIAKWVMVNYQLNECNETDFAYTPPKDIQIFDTKKEYEEQVATGTARRDSANKRSPLSESDIWLRRGLFYCSIAFLIAICLFLVGFIYNLFPKNKKAKTCPVEKFIHTKKIAISLPRGEEIVVKSGSALFTELINNFTNEKSLPFKDEVYHDKLYLKIGIMNYTVEVSVHGWNFEGEERSCRNLRDPLRVINIINSIKEEYLRKRRN